MFERATLSFGTTKVTSNVAFTAGSSQHGNARLASVALKINTFDNDIHGMNLNVCNKLQMMNLVSDMGEIRNYSM